MSGARWGLRKTGSGPRVAVRERLVLHLVVARLVEVTLHRRLRRTPRPAPAQTRALKIVVLDAFRVDGTVRTILTLAADLSRNGWDVELISVLRSAERPFFDIPAGVSVVVLDDRRPGHEGGVVRRALRSLRSVLLHLDDTAHMYWFTLWTDLQLLRHVRRLRRGVLITTRPAFNLFAARFAPSEVLVIGQEHMNLASHTEELRLELGRRYPQLDALAVLSDADRAEYEGLLPARAPRIVQIPNALPHLEGEPRAQREPIVLAAGRLRSQKGFDLLIEAFEPVAERFPDWQLHIYGKGGRRAELEQLAQDRGLAGHVVIADPTPHLGRRMAEVSIFALSSRYEGFGMVLVEAMSKGAAVVSFDCPRGPNEIISDGVDGLLVAPEDVPALSEALIALIEDDALRRRLGQAAVRTAQGYEPRAVGERWQRVIGELLVARA